MIARTSFSTQTAAWSFMLSISGRFQILDYGLELGRLDCYFVEYRLPAGRRVRISQNPQNRARRQYRAEEDDMEGLKQVVVDGAAKFEFDGIDHIAYYLEFDGITVWAEGGRIFIADEAMKAEFSIDTPADRVRATREAEHIMKEWKAGNYNFPGIGFGRKEGADA